MAHMQHEMNAILLLLISDNAKETPPIHAGSALPNEPMEVGILLALVQPDPRNVRHLHKEAAFVNRESAVGVCVCVLESMRFRNCFYPQCHIVYIFRVHLRLLVQ